MFFYCYISTYQIYFYNKKSSGTVPHLFLNVDLVNSHFFAKNSLNIESVLLETRQKLLLLLLYICLYLLLYRLT
jgi:hypothetical protein